MRLSEYKLYVRNQLADSLRSARWFELPTIGVSWRGMGKGGYHRAKDGERQPEHFVFPTCENGNTDPTKAQKSWRSAWRSLTRAIHCPACGKLQAPSRICRNEQCKTDIQQEVKSTLAGSKVSRSAPSRNHRACGIPVERQCCDLDCWSRLS